MIYDILANGAEGVIIRDAEGIIMKRRVSKGYRNPMLDKSIITSRTKREVKVLTTLAEKGVPVPTVLESDADKGIIRMKEILGEKLRDILDESNYRFYALLVGNLVATLHENGIIHADLTTSNMIVYDNKVYLIDFGLSFFSHKAEDMAVDLYLMHNTLWSMHYDIAKATFDVLKEQYEKRCTLGEEVIKRLELVQLRGRNKAK